MPWMAKASWWNLRAAVTAASRDISAESQIGPQAFGLQANAGFCYACYRVPRTVIYIAYVVLAKCLAGLRGRLKGIFS